MSHQTQGDVAVAEKVKTEEIPRFNVIVHNNDATSYDEVVFIISKVFEKSEDQAYDLAKEVDSKQKAVCGTYDKEVADSKILTTNLAKEYLIQRFSHRTEQIMALKFTVEQA
jgi:ATP-dependent Clp protease adaptor protein ClpS